VFDVPPASPAVGDILYIGIESAIVDSGPFTSVVFDLTLIGPNILGVAWEYWNGGWVNLIISEATIYDMVNGWFGVQGVGSIAFNQPGDWATNNPGMGVTGYWIRARITSIGWVMATSPQQRNRDIYTVVRPSVDIDELQVLGDIPALAQSLIYTWGDYHNIKSIIMGTRSSDRGSSFRMYLNLSDEQNPAGVNVTPGLNTAFAAYMEAPTGRAIRYNPGAGQTGVVSISLDASISNDYFGRYRCYLRVDREAAVTDCTAQLKIGLQDASGLYTSYYYTSETLTIASEVEAYLLDFGIVDVPGFGIAANNEILMPLIFEINLANTTANPDVYLYDLILIPIDEWSGEFANYNPDVNLEALGIVVYPEYHYLDVNSLDMKRRVSAFMRYSENGELRYSWKVITSEEMQLQANADQQLFVLMRSWDTADNVWIAEVKEIGTTQLYANARYLSMRGSR
jgi:hypothetical protein